MITMKPCGELLADRLKAVGVLPLNRNGVRRLAAVVLAISPPFVCALLAEGTGRWDLFERSGSITAAIGLLLASRRYIRHGVLELTMLRVNDALKSDIAEVLEDVVTGKLGLALSAFGSIIWGWGTYLGWWCFAFMAIWVIAVLRDAHRDSRTRAQSCTVLPAQGPDVQNGHGGPHCRS
jgi:hypothetical protein